MGRTKGSLNLTDAERAEIRALYRQGLRLEDIEARVGRGESAVARTVRGLKRKRPAPPRRNTKRDATILRLHAQGARVIDLARRYRVTPTVICWVVRRARREQGKAGKPGKPSKKVKARKPRRQGKQPARRRARR